MRHYVLYHLGAYPGLVPRSEAGQAISGEMYSIPCSLVSVLDHLEGAPHLFRLGPVALENHTGEAWAYFYQKSVEGAREIPSGCWDIFPDGDGEILGSNRR